MELRVTVQIDGEDVLVGRLFQNVRNGIETTSFSYLESYLSAPEAFALSPDMPLLPGSFHSEGLSSLRAFGDCMPDRWGRNLLLRAERNEAAREGRAARSLFECGMLAGVSDETRQGAIRIWRPDGGQALAPSDAGVPREVSLPKLLGEAFARSLVVGIALVFAAVITCIIIGEAGYEDACVVAFMLVLAPGVWLFVRGGILVSRIDVKEYNRDSVDELDVDDIVRSEGITPEQRESLLAEKLGAQGRARQLAGRACGVIMLAATAIALIWLFMAEALGAPGSLGYYFWLPWPIGGLCCAIANIVLSKDEEG